VLHVDSPGGSVAGLPEAADAIRHARGAKPIVAQVDTLAASAAYWLAAQADEIVVTPSSEVGSIGVFTAHFDFSKMLDTVGLKVTWIFAGRYKVEGNPAEPLQEDARVHLQSHVDHYYGMFVSAVAKGRGVGVEQVRKAWGEGRTVTAQDAVDRGMADSVGTLEETIRRVGRGKTSAPVPAAAAQDSWRARRQRMRELVAG
jgi:signal peptide peptidase SppA